MKLILSFSKIQKDNEGNMLLFEWLLYKNFFFCLSLIFFSVYASFFFFQHEMLSILHI